MRLITEYIYETLIININANQPYNPLILSRRLSPNIIDDIAVTEYKNKYSDHAG
jgi:hypothetical protein